MTTVRQPDETHVPLDPNTCEVLEGHQHKATDIVALAQSISLLGQINPIQVIQHRDGSRLIAAGRRRWMACKQLGCAVVANIWHSEKDDLDLELYARSIRIAENLERREPSAIDIAKQLRTIRSERGFTNAQELSAHVGMSESTVKEYLSFFRGSDHLQEVAEEHSFTLHVMLELVKCEKAFGLSKAKKLASQVAKGDISCRDLRRLRKKSTVTKKPRKARGSSTDILRSSCDSLLKLAAASPSSAREFLEAFLEEFSAILSSPASDESTTEV